MKHRRQRGGCGSLENHQVEARGQKSLRFVCFSATAGHLGVQTVHNGYWPLPSSLDGLKWAAVRWYRHTPWQRIQASARLGYGAYLGPVIRWRSFRISGMRRPERSIRSGPSVCRRLQWSSGCSGAVSRETRYLVLQAARVQAAAALLIPVVVLHPR